MNRKERKGGVLKNSDIEKELAQKGNDQKTGYQGSRDNGDSVKRATGTEVQQQDGIGNDEATEGQETNR